MHQVVNVAAAHDGTYRIGVLSSCSTASAQFIAGISSAIEQIRSVLRSPALVLLVIAVAQLIAISSALVTNIAPSFSSFFKQSEISSSQIHKKITRSMEHDSRISALATKQHQMVSVMKETIKRYGHNEAMARELASTIVHESRIAQLDPLLVAAVVKYESSFRTSAISNKGARGLMQVMPLTEKAVLQRISIHDLDLHDRQIRLGSHYLAELLKRFKGNIYYSLIAYNWGPTNLSIALKKGGEIPSGPRQYAKKIIAQRDSWAASVSTQG